MAAKLTRGEDQLELSLGGHPDFQAALAAARAIPGRRYDGEKKLWCFPEDPAIAERLMVTVRPEVSAEVLSWVKATKAAAAEALVSPVADDAKLLIPWANQRMPWQPEWVDREQTIPFEGLFGYQRGLVEFMVEQKHVINASDMGTGKTACALSAVSEYLLKKESPREPVLVICPNSVKGTWANECKRWYGEDYPCQIVDAASPKAREKQLVAGIKENGLVIVNWEQIRVKRVKTKQRVKIVHPITREFLRWNERVKEVEVLRQPLFEKTPWLAIIADEAHRAKNKKSLQFKGLKKLHAPLQFAMTGTPLQNSPDELWPLLNWLYPKEYTSFWRFFDQYVDFYEGQYGKIITGVKNPDALRFELSKTLARRTKKEVLDLPEKIRQYVPVTLSSKQRKLYKEAEKELWLEVEQAIKEGDKDAVKFAKAVEEGRLYQIVNGASRIVRLRQIASTPALLGGEDDSAKLDTAVELISDAQPKQFVVFSEFVGTCHALVERLKKLGIKAETYTGERTSDERTRLQEEFQNGDIDVIVGTIAAMKEGITLTAADTVIFIEVHWNPSVTDQCCDRLHRIGQKNAVTQIILEALDTVDTQKVSVTNAIKRLIVSAVIKVDDVREVR